MNWGLGSLGLLKREGSPFARQKPALLKLKVPSCQRQAELVRSLARAGPGLLPYPRVCHHGNELRLDSS